MAHAASKRVAHATVFTAFTSDYELGHLTLPYNRQYADRHGYDFVARIRPPFDWSLPGERHPSWDKVAILLELLDEHLDSPQHGKSATHILWVDADAVVIHQELSIDDLWADLPNSCELLLGEDVAPACLLNAGVFIVRVSEWSRQLWREVWGCQAAVRFHKRLYWEQSVLISVLIECGEGLERVKPFHSYRGGPELKVFDHVCVLPRTAPSGGACVTRLECLARALSCECRVMMLAVHVDTLTMHPSIWSSRKMGEERVGKCMAKCH